MKFSSKTNSFVIAALMMAVSVGGAFAGTPVKGVEKARGAVENAAPDDWETLAKSASLCIRKNTNLQEANEWIDKSIAIKATPYNLAVKGDYYLKNKLPKKAIAYYVKSMEKLKALDFYADTAHLEEKITAANRMHAKIG